MKKLILLSCICTVVSFSALSQVVYLADTAFTTDAGYDGAPASCVFTGGTATGWEMNRLTGTWLADVFTVPADTTWIFDTVIVYGIQAYSGTTSTFLSVNLQIYDTVLSLGASAIWGDTITNVLVNTGFTGIYRVDTVASQGGITGTIRPIMYLKLHLSPAPRLNQGTYWLSWSAVGTLSDTGTTGCPPKVLPGRINPPGQMGMGHRGNGAWGYILNNGQNEGFDKIIIGSAAVVASLTTPTINNHQLALLGQNAPNPFSGSTNISFYLQHAGFAKLLVYNTIGQIVATLLNGETNAGQHIVTFNSDNLPAGTYYYQLSTDSDRDNKQMLLVN